MMKNLSALLLVLVLVTGALGCAKSTTNTNQAPQTATNTETKTDDSQKILAANARQPVVVIKNPNTMVIETKAIPAGEIAAEKKMVEELGEMIVEAIATKGIDYTLDEVNKSRNGAFKAKIFPEKYFYLSFLENVEGVWTIVAHGTSTDFVGVQMALDTWADLSGWKYLQATHAKSNESNFIYTENVFWKDPAWADGKPSRFDAYSRFFNLENRSFWVYFSIWKDK